MPYTIKDDHHAKSVLAVEDYQGTPVIVHLGGHYPSLLENAGERVIDRLITVVQYHYEPARYVVSGQAGWHNGRLQTLSVGNAETLEAARALYPAALQAMKDAPDLYAEAYRLYGLVQGVPLNRADYEGLAAAWGFDAQPDEDLSPDGVFAFPEYPLADIPRLTIGRRRAAACQGEQEARRVERRKAREAADEVEAARLRSMPVLRTEIRLMPLGLWQQEYLRHGVLYTIIGRRPHRIDESDPAAYGEHLLGHEDEPGEFVTIEVRGETA